MLSTTHITLLFYSPETDSTGESGDFRCICLPKVFGERRGCILFPSLTPEDVAACISLLAIFMKYLHHDVRYLSYYGPLVESSSVDPQTMFGYNDLCP